MQLKDLLKIIKKQTLKAVKFYILVLVTIISSNILCAMIAFSFYNGEHQLLCVILCILVGVGILIFSIILTNRYLLLDVLHVAYSYLDPFFKKLSTIIVSKVQDKTINQISKEKIAKVIDISAIFSDTYNQKVPSIIKRSIMLLLRQIPFTKLLCNINEEMKSTNWNDETSLGDLFYIQLDTYIQTHIFMSNSKKWILWLIPLNVFIQLMLIIFID